MLSAEALAQVRFDDRGLVAAIAQDWRSGRLLMLAWMNAEALRQTLASGYATYWSRSRQRLWRKGEESGHLQRVRSMHLDCDGDALLLQVEQRGVACHTGRMSCFFHRWHERGWLIEENTASDGAAAGHSELAEAPEGSIPPEGLTGLAAAVDATRTAYPSDARQPASQDDTLERLSAVIRLRREADPQRSYVARLLARGEDAILKKVGEEATECVLAAKDGEAQRIVAECADLWFHCLVMLEHYRLAPGDVLRELARREGISGLDEKAARKAQERDHAPENRAL